MLGGRPLPPLTVFILRGHEVFLSIGILVPVVAIGIAPSDHRVVRSFYLLGGLGILTTAQFIVLYHGLSAP